MFLISHVMELKSIQIFRGSNLWRSSCSNFRCDGQGTMSHYCQIGKGSNEQDSIPEATWVENEIREKHCQLFQDLGMSI